MEIAYGGLDCGACPAFHRAERLTLEERGAVAVKWHAAFGGTNTAADIDCVGCTHDGRHPPFCENGCEIRACGAAKAVATCAECKDYGCDKLAGFLANVPDARANLEARRPS